MHFEHALVELCSYRIGIDAGGQPDGSAKGATQDLGAVDAALLGLFLVPAFTAGGCRVFSSLSLVFISPSILYVFHLHYSP
ncbi:MAG: hypothetical protein WBG92_10870 [Thiohalocapsa sp.]